jgi:uncharacterized protein (DUF983 family)
MTPIQQSVPVATAMGRGFKMKCPHCGTGDLFGRFLKVADHCPACGEAFHHHRADDFPAYLVIAVVGHVIVPAILAVEVAYAPPTWLQLVVWLPLTLISSLALLQPTKGAIVGLQWRECMASRRRNSGGWTTARFMFRPRARGAAHRAELNLTVFDEIFPGGTRALDMRAGRGGRAERRNAGRS